MWLDRDAPGIRLNIFLFYGQLDYQNDDKVRQSLKERIEKSGSSNFFILPVIKLVEFLGQ